MNRIRQNFAPVWPEDRDARLAALTLAATVMPVGEIVKRLLN
jgi:hypothetical protein